MIRQYGAFILLLSSLLISSMAISKEEKKCE